jgi:ribonuclease HI
MSVLKIYTDGACSGNPGPGGWGVVIEAPSGRQELSGHHADTTNNRMELQAAIEALKNTEGSIEIHTDSNYVKDGITLWMTRWKKNGWRTASNKDVKNQDLWQILDALCAQRDVTWIWVRGHAGDPGNDRADFLARHAIVQEMMQAGLRGAS